MGNRTYRVKTTKFLPAGNRKEEFITFPNRQDAILFILQWLNRLEEDSSEEITIWNGVPTS